MMNPGTANLLSPRRRQDYVVAPIISIFWIHFFIFVATAFSLRLPTTYRGHGVLEINDCLVQPLKAGASSSASLACLSYGKIRVPTSTNTIVAVATSDQRAP
jgi:hypothetical protein